MEDAAKVALYKFRRRVEDLPKVIQIPQLAKEGDDAYNLAKKWIQKKSKLELHFNLNGTYAKMKEGKVKEEGRWFLRDGEIVLQDKSGLELEVMLYRIHSETKVQIFNPLPRWFELLE